MHSREAPVFGVCDAGMPGNAKTPFRYQRRNEMMPEMDGVRYPVGRRKNPLRPGFVEPHRDVHVALLYLMCRVASAEWQQGLQSQPVPSWRSRCIGSVLAYFLVARAEPTLKGAPTRPWRSLSADVSIPLGSLGARPLSQPPILIPNSCGPSPFLLLFTPLTPVCIARLVVITACDHRSAG